MMKATRISGIREAEETEENSLLSPNAHGDNQGNKREAQDPPNAPSEDASHQLETTSDNLGAETPPHQQNRDGLLGSRWRSGGVELPKKPI